MVGTALKPRKPESVYFFCTIRDVMMRTTFLAFLLVLISGVRAAAPEWSGLFVIGDTARVTLVDAESNVNSEWLTIGDSFAGYLLKAYQPETKTLVLEAEGREFPLQLRSATIKDATIAFSGTITLGTGDVAKVVRATLTYGKETTFPLAPDVTLTLKPTAAPHGSTSFEMRIERRSPDGKRELLSAPTVLATLGQPFRVQVGDFGFELTPRK